MKTKFYTKTLIAVFAMLLIVLNVFPQAPPPTTTIPTLTNRDGIIIVPVTVSNFDGVGNISLKLNYDPGQLIYQNVVVNAAIPAGNTITTTAPNASGQFVLSYSQAFGDPVLILPNGTVLFTLTFAVKAGVTNVTTPFTWSSLQGDCNYSTPSTVVFNPEITAANFSTYFLNGSVDFKAIPVISGPNFVCSNSVNNIYTTEPGMSNYNWIVSNGGTITAGASTNSIMVTWPASSGSHSLSVNYKFSSGVLTESIPYTVNVTPQVGTPTPISIVASTEPNLQLTNATTTTTYATTASDNTGFNWSISNAAAGTINPTTGVMTWANGFFGSVDIQVTANGCNGLSTQVIKVVNIAPRPIVIPPTTTISVLTCQEGIVSVPVTVNNFKGVGNISLKLNYDRALLTYQDIVVNPAISTSNTFATTPPDASGQFSLSYSGAHGVPGITLPDGTTLFTLTFAIKAGTSNALIPLIWSTLQGNCDYSPPSPDVFTPLITTGNFSNYFINGSVTTKPIPVITGPSSVCPGSIGIIYTTDPGMSNYSWNIPIGGTITAGATTNSITVTWGETLGLHSLSVNYTDATGCTASTPSVYSVNINSTIIPKITGPNSVCIGSTGMVYTTDPGQNIYVWVIKGGIITSGGNSTSNTATVTWNTSGAQSITADYTPSVGCETIPTVYTVDVTPTVGTPTPITITAGSDPTCQLVNGITTTTYSTTATDNTGFVWSISNAAAGSIDVSTGVMTWKDGFAGSVDIRVIANGCNSPSSQVSHLVTVTPTVGTPSAITISAGSDPTCQLVNGTTTTTYATTASDNTGFSWSISNNNAGSIDAATGVMTWKDGFAGSVDIHVIANGCNSTSLQVSHSVTVTPTVGTPTAITISAGSDPTCQLVNGTTTTTYATTASDNTGFTWSVSNAAAGSIDAATGVMTWKDGFAGSVDIHVIANGCNSPSSQVSHSVTVTPTVGTPTAITISAGSDPTCQLVSGTTTTTYATTASDNTGFTWSISNAAAGSIDASTGVMTWKDGFAGSVDIHVIANGCNSPSSQVSHSVTVTPTVGTPTAITISAGSDPTCQLVNGTTTTTYATTASDNTGFTWSISNTNAGSIDASTGVMSWKDGFAGSVDIHVIANGCNSPSAQVSHSVTVTPTVGTPTAITISAGSDPTCQLVNGTTTTTYATTASDNTGFTWSISNAAAGSIDAATGVMSWKDGFAGSVDIHVIANGCNSPSSQVSHSVTVTPTVGTPTAITISAGSDPTCQLVNGTTTTTYATTASDNTGFTWSISNTNAGSIDASTGVMSWKDGFAGSVDIHVIANGCNSPSSQVSHSVTVTPTVGTPTAITISAGSDPTCQLVNGTTTTTYATTASDNTGFTWSISNTNAGSIDASTGVMSWKDGFAGSVDIHVIANGCNSPSSQVSHSVTVTPTVGTPTAIKISAGSDPTCQLVNGTTTTTYATTASDNTGFSWSISNTNAGSIDAATGVMSWKDGFAGSVDIHVIANGCNSPSSQVSHSVTVTPTVGTPTAISISAGSEPTCQLVNGTTTTTYATIASDNTGFSWSISNTNAGSIDAATGVMSWKDGFAGSVDIHVIANGCNSPSAQVIRSVTVTPTVGTPTAITISAGSDPTCQLVDGTTTTTYATTASDNTGFTWSISNTNAGSIDAATGVMTWNDGFSGSVDIHVIANGCNSPSSQVSHSVTVTPTVGTPTAITISDGSDPTCQLVNGTTTTTYATTASDNTGFVWSISNADAGSIDASTGVMTWNDGFAGSVDIHVIANGCNSPSSQVSHSVTVTPTVGTPTAITISAGSEPTCQLANGAKTTNYATTATNNNGFVWSISNVAAGTINASTGVMTWKDGFAGNVDIRVIANGCNSPSSRIIRSVSITQNVANPIFTLGASSSRCSGAGTIIYSASATNSTGISYSLDALSLASGNKINSTTGAMTFMTGWVGKSIITATATGCNGIALANHTITINPLPMPTISGPASVCINSTGNVYTTESGMTNYVWSVPTGGTITAGGTTNSNTVTVKWNTSGPQAVTVIYSNATGCNALTATSYLVSVNPLPVPTLTGPSTICLNTPGNVYNSQVGMSNYAWTISSGGVITAGGTSTSNTVTVTWNTAGPQTINLTYANASGCQSINPVTFNVMVNAVPNPAGSLTGSASVNAGATGVTYSIGLIPNTTSYIWSLPGGATIASGNGTNSITVDYALNASAGNITVYGINGCGSGIASTPFAVSINTFPVIPGNVSGPSTVCQGTTGIVYSVPLINFATSYVWTIPTGATIISGATTNSITVNYGLTAVSGNVTVYGTNTSGNGPGSSPLVITVNPLPVTPVITVDAATGVILTSSAASGNQWYNDNGQIVGAISKNYTAIHNGNFYVMVTGACTSAKSNTIAITRVSVIASDKQKISVYPNPSNGGFWVEYKASENEKLKMVQVLDLLGKPVYQLIQSTPTSDYKEWVNIRNHQVGVYILILTTENRKISRRIVITR